MPAGIAITFPTSPIQGQEYLAQNGFTYVYDSQKNRWDRAGSFVRPPKVLTFAGVAATTTGSGVTTGPNGSLIYNVPGFLIPSSDVGVDSYKAYRTTDSYPNYTEIQVSISSAFSTIAYAATSTSTTLSIPAGTLSGNTTYYMRARQFVGSNASAASTGAISGYSQNIVSFATTALFIDAPTIVSIAATTRFPAYQIGFAATTLPATVTYTGSGVGNLDKVEWRVTGPRIPSSTGDTALAEVGVGTFSSATLANSLVLAMPFSGASGVGITSDVNNAIRTASSASAGTTKTVTAVGTATTVSIAGLAGTSHFYPCAASGDGTDDYLTVAATADLQFGAGDFTIEFWWYPNGTGRQALYHGSFGTDWSIGIDYNSVGTNKMGIWASSSGTSWNMVNADVAGNGICNTTVPQKQWNHIAYVRRGNTFNLYLNGLLDCSASASGTIIDRSSSSTAIGTWFSTTSMGEFTGYLQDLKVYKGLAKYQENFTPPLPTYGTISYTTGTTYTGINTTAFFESTGDIPTAEVAIGSSTAAQVASSLVLAMPMNRTFGFQDINVAVRGLTSGASAGTAKTVGLGTTSTANAPSQPRISSTESKWYDGAGYFDTAKYATVNGGLTASGTGDFTYETWIYPISLPGASGYNIVFDHRSGSVHTTGMFMYISSSGKLGIYNITESTNSVTLNQWNHIAYVRSGGTLTYYINGISGGSQSFTRNNTDTVFYFNTANDSLGSYTWVGYRQDTKIYQGLAKYTANFTPPRPICGFTTDISTQTGFTTTTASGALLSSVVGLGSTSTLAFSADQNLAGVTSITSSSGITTLPDPYAQNLVLALPLANITGVGNSFTNDRNTQIRSVSITGAGVTAGTTKAITNSGVTTVSVASTTQKSYDNIAKFTRASETFVQVTHTLSVPLTVEGWVYLPSLATAAQMFFNGNPHPTIGISLNRTGQGDTYVYLGNGSSWSCTPCITSSFNITAGKWWHIALVCDGVQTRLYHDGLLVGTSSITPSGFGGSCRFGRNDAGTGAEAFDGYMQDLRLYNFAKYTTNFTPPPPMFGDYTRSTPNKLIYTPSSDYVLEARNTSGIVTSNYSATRQWGTKPKGGIYDPYASNLVLAIPGGAVGGATTTFDVTGQIRYETPTATYVNAGIVTYSNSLGIGTYQNKSGTNTNFITSTTQSKFYGRSIYIAGNGGLSFGASNDFIMGTSDYCIELWCYINATTADADLVDLRATDNGNNPILNYASDTSTVTMKSYGTTLTGTFAYQTWAHVALAKSNGILRMFINGIQTGQVTDSRTNTEGTLNIGQPNFTTSYRATVYINDLRIYKGLAKYTSNFTPPNQIYLT